LLPTALARLVIVSDVRIPWAQWKFTGFNPFAGWPTVVAHLQLRDRRSLGRPIRKAAQAALPAGSVAASTPGDGALRDFVFGGWLTATIDGFKPLAVTDVTVDSQVDEPLRTEAAMSRWREWPVKRQTEELLLAGLQAATVWKADSERRSAPAQL
jgi:hypothetical protein